MKYDVVIIGSSAGGLTAALATRKFYPDKSILVIKKDKVSLIPCGISYIFGSLKQIDDDILPAEKLLKANNVDLLVDEVVSVDLKEKTLETKGGKKIGFEKLILATGSSPILPEVEGAELEGVYVVPKDYEYLKKLREEVLKSEKIVIVGASFVAIEVGTDIRRLGKRVALIVRSRLLRTSFDPEFAEIVEKKLKELGIEVVYGRVKRLVGDGRVSGVELEDGRVVDADLVIFAIGYKPNVELAKKMGLKVTEYGIWTDEYMRTSHPDVFAVGDCVEHRDFFTSKPVNVMLAPVATLEARVAAANLFGLRLVRDNKGVIGVFPTVVDGLTIAAGGLTEERAKKEGFDVVVGTAKVADRHPAKFPDTSQITLKLIFSKDRGVLLGAQVAGGKSVAELMNILALAIQKGLTAPELYTLQVGTHPMLTASPIGYPIVKAAEDALVKLGLPTR